LLLLLLLLWLFSLFCDLDEERRPFCLISDFFFDFWSFELGTIALLFILADDREPILFDREWLLDFDFDLDFDNSVFIFLEDFYFDPVGLPLFSALDLDSLALLLLLLWLLLLLLSSFLEDFDLLFLLIVTFLDLDLPKNWLDSLMVWAIVLVLCTLDPSSCVPPFFALPLLTWLFPSLIADPVALTPFIFCLPSSA
jgi:hypothetical protein